MGLVNARQPARRAPARVVWCDIPVTVEQIAPGSWFASSTSAMILVTATVHRFVVGAPFLSKRRTQNETGRGMRCVHEGPKRLTRHGPAALPCRPPLPPSPTALPPHYRPAALSPAPFPCRPLPCPLSDEPEHDVAAGEADGAVPAVDGDGKVEGGDDADRAERVPLLEDRVVRALRRDDAAVEHAAQAGHVVGHVDVLLHLAQPLALDLAHLQRDQAPECILLLWRERGARGNRERGG